MTIMNNLMKGQFFFSLGLFSISIFMIFFPLNESIESLGKLLIFVSGPLFIISFVKYFFET